MISRLIVLIIIRLIDYRNNRLLQPYLTCTGQESQAKTKAELQK